MGHQPPVAASAAAERRAAADLADEPDRRDLPLPRGGTARLFRHRPQDHPGLDPGASLQGRARGHRRQWLGRQDQDLCGDRDLNKLIAYGLTLPQMLQVLNNSNINVGGQTVNFGAQSAVVRGVGLIHSMDDIRDTMLTPNNGSPVLVKDVATVTVDHEPRLGIAGQDNDDDIVQGIVLMRRGAESLPTLKLVEGEIERINAGNILPPGVHIEKIYNRTDLINVTTHTVLHNMIVGILLIFAVQWIFLGDLRSAIIVARS